MTAGDTIAAVSTPPGHGGIGIVRISGPLTRSIVKAVTGFQASARQAHFVSFKNKHGELIDQGLLILFTAPASYTGEDLAELHAHGNPYVLDELVRQACVHGARPALPGEFTERAFLNNKLDLAQAEAVQDLIASQSLRAAQSAQRSLRGHFSQVINAIVEKLETNQALIETSIDFSDDVIGNDLVEDCQLRHQALLSELHNVITRAEHGSRVSAGVNIAIIGPPNVGKSSLINALAEEDIAIVTRQAGTTRDTNTAQIKIDGVPFSVIDTAGIHDTKDEIESEGIKRSYAALARADVVLLVADITAAQAINPLKATLNTDYPEIKHFVVFNKTDLLAHSPKDNQHTSEDCVYLSVLRGDGMATLRARLLKAGGVGAANETEFSARRRHIEALETAATALKEVNPTAMISQPEIVAEHYRVARNALDAIVGRYDTEQLLGDIFSRFCIGK